MEGELWNVACGSGCRILSCSCLGDEADLAGLQLRGGVDDGPRGRRHGGVHLRVVQPLRHRVVHEAARQFAEWQGPTLVLFPAQLT